MLKRWTALWMGLIFVIATLTGPVHARTVAEPAAVMADCHQMMAAVEKHGPGKPAHGDDCCKNGCACPLSHNPATAPAGNVVVVRAVFGRVHRVAMAEAPSPRSALVERLKRPPKI